MLKRVFSPYKIGSCVIPNRLFVPAMVMNYCTDDGMITDRYIRYMEEKAKGGWGLIITEDYAVQEHGKGYFGIPGLWKDEQIEGSRKLTDTIHQYDSKIFCQMYHPGRQTTMQVTQNTIPVAPSATVDPLMMTPTRELSVEEIHQLVQDCGKAAGRVKEAGFDGLEIHCAHGYLMAEFLSPLVNKRVDEYGGCFENRIRLLDEVYTAVREAVGPDFPIQIRVSGNEYVQGGRTEAETCELCVHLEDLGVDSINVSNGVYASKPKDQIIAPMFTDHALNMNIAEQVKKLVNIPVLVANRINDPRMAETLLAMDKADFIGMGRGSLADPYLPEKAKNGQLDCVRYCIGCLQGCEGYLLYQDPATCLVNPRVGREYEDDLKKADKPKKVMVAGAGPAGLVAAETAALRGHDVTVYEEQEEIGGQFRSAAYPTGKGELSTFASQLRTSLMNLNVPIILNTPVTEDLIEAEKPEAIILATGAKPLTLPIDGIENAVTAEDILLGRKYAVEGPVVVCGGGEVGAETAQYISTVNHDVTVLEMQDSILNDMMPMTKICLEDLMRDTGVKVVTEAKVSSIGKDSVSYTNSEGEEITIPAETVVSAFGYKAYNPLEEIAKKYYVEVYTVGGAVKAGNAIAATKEGYEAGLKI